MKLSENEFCGHGEVARRNHDAFMHCQCSGHELWGTFLHRGFGE